MLRLKALYRNSPSNSWSTAPGPLATMAATVAGLTNHSSITRAMLQYSEAAIVTLPETDHAGVDAKAMPQAEELSVYLQATQA